MFASGSALAAKAQVGYLIFNNNKNTYTTPAASAGACPGITFPASVATTTSSTGAVIQGVTSANPSSFPCTTTYTSSSGTCQVTLTEDTNSIKLTATDQYGGKLCSVSGNNTILTFHNY
ncbi:MAG: hypothetical protein A3E82_08385 [Gammaproteobacteria bacterium RIFCSPHIGHO2_12_FULL_38_11]|nr:MAG: hypothetical protein A3E82_08385 [Gammaproteobacteria bacterium RIFCSPHIGHO2_12_FULL_38_11]